VETIPILQDLDESSWIERAAMCVTDLGTSVSQLLGQNFATEDRIPAPTELFIRLLNAARKKGVTIPETIEDRFSALIKAYDQLRHFGPSKHQSVREALNNDFDNQRLAEYFTVAQETWRLVLSTCADGEEPNWLDTHFEAAKEDEE